MPIVFRCTNVAGFDDDSQSYVVCNQKLRVHAERAGATITCPKCEQALEVPAANEGPESFSEPGKTSSTGTPSDLRDKPDVMQMEFAADAKTSSKTFAKTSDRCAQCGGRYNKEFVCESCGYIEPVNQARRRAASDDPPKLAGFQLWISKITNDGVSIKHIGYAIVSVVTLFCLLTMAWGVLSTSFPGIVCAVMAAFLLIFTFVVLKRTRQLANQRYASLGVLAPIWSMLLMLARMFEWEKYDGRLRDRKVIDLRKTPVTDQELLSRSDLESCQVLDLEDSPVTDVGIRGLYRLKYLQCLVVRNTDVSAEELFKLQQQKPHLWIWS